MVWDVWAEWLERPVCLVRNFRLVRAKRSICLVWMEWDVCVVRYKRLFWMERHRDQRVEWCFSLEWRIRTRGIERLVWNLQRLVWSFGRVWRFGMDRRVWLQRQLWSERNVGVERTWFFWRVRGVRASWPERMVWNLQRLERDVGLVGLVWFLL